MKTIRTVLIMIVFLTSVAACGGRATPAPGSTARAEARRAQVQTVDSAGGRAALQPLQERNLSVGEGVDVDATGSAVVKFSDLLLVEVLRDGDLAVRQFTEDNQSAVIDLSQTLGVLVGDFNPQKEIDRRLSINGDFVKVEVAGTKFMLVREADTPLWWLAGLDASSQDLLITGNGITKDVVTGQVRWIAPIGEPSQSIDMQQGNVQSWLEGLRAGQPQTEFGEIVWPQADALTDTRPVEELPPPGQPFTLEGVTLTLDPKGLFGSPKYWLDDCNGDGIRDIAMQGGKVLFDFRPVVARVRALDVTIWNRTSPGSGAVTVFDPKRGEMNSTPVTASAEQGEVIALRSQPGQPYHYAELALTDGCFLGFSLTPPSGGIGEPGPARPAAPIGGSDDNLPPPPPPTRTPTPPARPTATPTVVRRPSATPTPEPPVCTIVPARLNLRSGPGTNYEPPLRSLASGTELDPLARTPRSDWIQVRVRGANLTGWVNTQPRFIRCNFDVRQLPEGRIPPTPTPLPTVAPSFSFRADRTDIKSGECVTLIWDVENVRALFLNDQGVVGHDKRQVCPKQTTTYTLRAETAGRPLQQSITIKVSAAPASIQFTADRASIKSGECTVLRWSVENVRAVYLDGEGVVGQGKRQVCPTSTQTYNLRVVRFDGEETRKITIKVTPACPVFSASFYALKDPESIELYWETTGGCAPYIGTITGRYAHESEPFAKYTVDTPSGIIYDKPPVRCEGTFTIIYTFDMTDGSGQRLTPTYSIDVQYIC